MNPSQRWCTRSWDFHTVSAGIDLGTTVFVLDLLELHMYGRLFVPGMGPYNPRVPLASRTPANQQSASGVGVSTPCGVVSNRGTTVFVPDLLDLQMCEKCIFSLISSTPGIYDGYSSEIQAL